MKILLLCAAGMSTSMLVSRMKKSADSQGIEAEIKAMSIENFGDEVSNWDIFFLGPQVRFKKDEFSQIACKQDKQVLLISPSDYGMMNGEKVLKLAIDALES